MEKQLKRSEVPEALKWDLTLLYKSGDSKQLQRIAKYPYWQIRIKRQKYPMLFNNAILILINNYCGI